jgi:hypothetical protein
MFRPLASSLGMAVGLFGLASVALASSAGTVLIATGSGNVVVPGATGDPSYSLGGTNPYEADDGGEFTVFATLNGHSGNYIPSQYAPAAILTIGAGTGFSSGQPAGTGFESFCAEDQVTFTTGVTYNWQYGLTLSGEPAGEDALGHFDITTLTVGAAWLYEQFATGTLSNYFSSDTQTRINDAGLLQSALWALEGEIPSNGTPGDTTVPLFEGGSSNLFLSMAETHFGSLEDAEAAVTYGNHLGQGGNEWEWGVQLMEITDNQGNFQQAQFIYSGRPSVPDTAATLALLTLSLAGIVTLRRRYAPAL